MTVINDERARYLSQSSHDLALSREIESHLFIYGMITYIVCDCVCMYMFVLCLCVCVCVSVFALLLTFVLLSTCVGIIKRCCAYSPILRPSFEEILGA